MALSKRLSALTLSLATLAPQAGGILVTARAQEARPPAPRAAAGRARKMTDDLLARVSTARGGRGDTARVILDAAGVTPSEDLLAALRGAGARVRSQLDGVGLVVADVPVERLAELSERGDVSWVSSDQPVVSTADNTSHHEVTTGASKFLPVGAEALAAGGGGNRVGIAVLDSGVSPPDAAEFAGYEWQQSSGTLGTGLLSQKYLASYPRLVKHMDFTGEGTTEDHYGHGTHTAGVAAGSGQASEDYAASNAGAATHGGIATGAHLVSVRVLDSKGAGTVSGVVAGIDWVVKNRKTYNVRVMNLSLGAAPTQSYKTDPLCQAVGRAVDAGIVVVVSAGNWGKDAAGRPIFGGILSPAMSPRVITVGATNTYQTDARSDDTVATYSSRGPTLVDGFVKPDLVAPGNKLGATETAVSSASASNSYTSTGGGGLLGGLVSGDTSTNKPVATSTYRVMSGTSFAAPVVSGTVALMLEANPSLTPSIVKAILMRTAQRLPLYERLVSERKMSPFERVITEGAGELNVAAALTVARAVRKDAGSAAPGQDLITNKKLTYSKLGLNSPIAGEEMPLNNGLIWAEGVAFNERLTLTHAYRLPNGVRIRSGFVMVDGVLLPDGTYLFGDGRAASPYYILGSGIVMGDQFVLGDGIVMGDKVVMGDGIVMGDACAFGNGIVIGDGIVMGDKVLMGDGIVMGDRFSTTYAAEPAWASNLIEPASMRQSEEQVMLQGESAMPSAAARLNSASPLYPRKK